MVSARHVLEDVPDAYLQHTCLPGDRSWGLMHRQRIRLQSFVASSRVIHLKKCVAIASLSCVGSFPDLLSKVLAAISADQ
jgi:hypothetical protein